ncbi:5-fold beta-flower protein [Arcticibacter eurypsychrophilus]|uniref:5-fold beta-flower protein n=1 Tax=Arcticibacter eurypsychrophilus TaxID=1434752 RepID=UPI00084E07BA|nr:hypothetical protein [Arcticibacter eurypsychrophilus]
MKKLKTIFVLLIIFLAGTVSNSHAQGVSPQSKKIAIDAKGGIHNHLGTKLGYIDKDNIVRNNKGQKIYFIDKSGNVIDANGKRLGKAEKNGNFYNTQGTSVITVRDKDAAMCEILDPEGHTMGTVHKNYKLHACAAHCLMLKEKKDKAKI